MQLLANSDKLRDAEEALSKIRGRHEDIQRLAKSLAELHEMFTDLALMVHQQVRPDGFHAPNAYIDSLERANLWQATPCIFRER